MDRGRQIADAQLRLARSRQAPIPLLDALAGATSPDAVRAAIDAALPGAIDALREGCGPHPSMLRNAFAQELKLSPADLSFRRLYPGLDIGIYACSHSMGVPSVAGPAAVIDQLAQLSHNGIGVWDDGLWVRVIDQYRARCAELVGGNLDEGDVTWFPNVSEALSAVLEGIDGGTLVYTGGHFTTGHYVHHQWARNTGGRLVEVPVDADGSVPTERIIANLTPDVRVLSISHALFESGWLQDLPALAAALREKCPDALLLVDAYQTAGTVPIDAAALGDHVAVAAGGHKQLRASAGAGFLYMPRRWCSTLTPRRTGWWGHAEPFAFEKGEVRRSTDGGRFRTGTPTVIGMAMLLGELASLASSAGGSLQGAVARARRVTSGIVDHAMTRAAEAGLTVRGEWPAECRGAFLCILHEHGRQVNEALGRSGIRIDFRPSTPSSDAGYLRVSGSGATFAYEIDAVMNAIRAHR